VSVANCQGSNMTNDHTTTIRPLEMSLLTYKSQMLLRQPSIMTESKSLRSSSFMTTLRPVNSITC